MYLSAMEFLEEEREAWRPFEALGAVSDDRFELPVPAAHGWSARDLIGHVVAWQEWALAAAKDLALGETSPTIARLDAMSDADVDALNADVHAEWETLPRDEVRRRLAASPGELRGYLTVVPESRWVKHATNLQTFLDETIDHYADHVSDLDAILEAAAG